MRAVARSGDGAGRSDGDRKQGTAGKPQNGDGIYRAGVWARVRQERFCRSCRGRAHSERAAALVIVAARITACGGVDFDDGHSSATAAELASYRRDESRSGSPRQHLPQALAATGFLVCGFADKAQVRMVCQTWQRPVWWRRFLRPSGRCREPHQVRSRGLRRSHGPLG